MKITIINCFDTYEDRVDMIYELMSSDGHQVNVIQSNFKHNKKARRHDQKPGFEFIDTMTYRRNLSVRRLTSHYLFAKKAILLAKESKPDLIYALIPPNSLMKFSARLKRKQPEIKFVFDIIDLWPETLPTGSLKKLPPFDIWRNLRDHNLHAADYLVTECDLYREVLGDRINDIPGSTLYLAKRFTDLISNPNLSRSEIQLGYLGSINNIINIDKIKSIVAAVQRHRPVRVHIVGTGESKDLLISELEKTGAKAIDYGEIFDASQKQQIFDQCHFGINIMKESVCVGLTMKSIDYFQIGLPILNSIQSDTARLVEKYNVGYNLTGIQDDELAQKIIGLSIEDLLKMREAARQVYLTYFSQEMFNRKLRAILRELQ